MIADDPEVWDAAPLNAVLTYKGGAKQAWDNTDLTGPWLNGMRNSLNSQIWGFKEPNFLCVSATDGPAHLALYDPKARGPRHSCRGFRAHGRKADFPHAP